MKRTRVLWAFIFIVFLTIITLSYFSPYFNVYNGRLAVIKMEPSGGTAIYLLYPYINYWKRLTPNEMTPFQMSWSPDGKTMAFSYGIYDENGAPLEGGIALINMSDEEVEKVYVAPENGEALNIFTWSSDGQELIFDSYKNGYLTAFHKLDIKTKRITVVGIPEAAQFKGYVNSFIVTSLDEFVIENGEGLIYSVSGDLQNVKLVSRGGNLFLNSNRENVTFFCHRTDLNLCSLDVESGKASKITAERMFSGYVTDASWSHDERYLFYLQRAGEGDPVYLKMLDFLNDKTYTILKSQNIIHVAWYSDH